MLTSVFAYVHHLCTQSWATHDRTAVHATKVCGRQNYFEVSKPVGDRVIWRKLRVVTFGEHNDLWRPYWWWFALIVECRHEPAVWFVWSLGLPYGHEVHIVLSTGHFLGVICKGPWSTTGSQCQVGAIAQCWTLILFRMGFVSTNFNANANAGQCYACAASDSVAFV